MRILRKAFHGPTASAYCLAITSTTWPIWLRSCTTQAESNTVTAALTKAQCTAAKSLSIQVNPQFGRLDYSQYTVVASPNTLSQPAGKPSPASTAGLTPAC